MNSTNNPKLTSNAQSLRKSMTKEERHLWYDFLKRLPVTVNRQKVIGKYIVDFYCAEAKLIIEVDGSQHYAEQGAKTGRERDTYLKKLGYTFYAFPMQRLTDSLKGCVQRFCGTLTPHPPQAVPLPLEGKADEACTSHTNKPAFHVRGRRVFQR